MRRLAKEVLEHREKLEHKNFKDEELLKQSIARVIPLNKDEAPPKPFTPLPAYADDAPPEVKLEIEYLLDIALHHGLQKANAAARKSSDFVIDAFHDALAGKLYPEMKRRGLL